MKRSGDSAGCGVNTLGRSIAQCSAAVVVLAQWTSAQGGQRSQNSEVSSPVCAEFYCQKKPPCDAAHAAQTPQPTTDIDSDMVVTTEEGFRKYPAMHAPVRYPACICLLD